MHNRDEILRGAVAASQSNTEGVDEAFIIDYLIEKLIFEQHRANVLLKIHDEVLKERYGTSGPHQRKSGLSLQRIFIPYLDRFDQLFNYRRNSRLVVLWPKTESKFYLLDEYGATENDDSGYWMLVGYKVLKPIFAAHRIATNRHMQGKWDYMLLVDRRRRAFYACEKVEVFNYYEVVCDRTDQKNKRSVLQSFTELDPKQVLLEMEKELIRTYGDGDVGPQRFGVTPCYLPESRSMVYYGVN